jgi:DNA mismatch repair protein MSH4
MSVTLTLYQLPLQFRLKDGVRRVPHYGLLLARVAGIPTSVIDTSTSITSQIMEQVIWHLYDM